MNKLRRIVKVLRKGIKDLKKELSKNDIKKGSSNAGRPRKDGKKEQINVKVPPWLNDWMRRQPESKAILIETALISYYQIPEGIQKEKI